MRLEVSLDKRIIPPLPDTCMPSPAIHWAAMARKARVTREELTNDPSCLPPGYKALLFSPQVTLTPKQHTRVSYSTDTDDFIGDADMRSQ